MKQEDELEVVWSGRDPLLPPRESKRGTVWDELALQRGYQKHSVNKGLYKIPPDEEEWLRLAEEERNEKVDYYGENDNGK